MVLQGGGNEGLPVHRQLPGGSLLYSTMPRGGGGGVGCCDLQTPAANVEKSILSQHPFPIAVASREAR